MPAVMTKLQPDTPAAGAASYSVSCRVQRSDKCCLESLGVDIDLGRYLRNQLQELFSGNLRNRLRTGLV